MEDYSRERRGLFEGLKVPFCLNALLVAFIGLWIFRLGNFLLFKAIGGPAEAYANWGVVDQIWTFIRNIILGGGITKNAFTWENLIYAVWFVIAWAFFAGAIARIMAMRIARDETIELKSALAFAAKRFGTHIFAVLFIVIAMVFFYACCMLAGVVGRIPYAGPIILVFLYILVFASILIVTLLAVGMVLGFNLISASIATDGVDTFDAISRAYSYVFSRPWQILLYTVLPFTFLIIFFAFAEGIFLNHTLGAVGVGMGPKWGYEFKVQTGFGGSEKETVGPRGFVADVDNWEMDKYLAKPWQDSEGKDLTDKDYEGMKEKIKGMEENRGKKYDLINKLDDKYKNIEDPNAALQAKRSEKNRIESEIDRINDQISMVNWRLNGKPNAAIYILAIVVKIMYFIAFYLIIAYIVAYWVGSQTVAYFLLRKDVDGDRLEEVYLDEGEEEDSYFSFDAAKTDEKKEEKKEEPEEKKEEEPEKENEEKPKKKKAPVKKKGGRASKRKKKED